MKLLAPTVWLIHLGVNDERAKVPATSVAANLEAIVDLLMNYYGAAPERIYLARPCYDYAEGAEPILREYCGEIEKLITRRHLRQGPDFFKAFSVDKAKWYGTDPVHPNIEGMDYMARLWAECLSH
jgi:lysophospholipase L1-like esterase